ncbi:MAG: DNA polymerase III subunit chi [Gammaproteobacteria bacterium]|nr:DNA polymerase III subunit chi [Gammaproteobacteria bacterium]
MSRVDFYLLKGAQPNGKLIFTARLAGKICRLGHRAYIHAHNEAQAQALDDLLWTFDQSSFIPHQLADHASAPELITPVVVGFQPPYDFNYNVLISLLEDDIPDCCREFERVAEIVAPDPQDKKRARDRFRRYRDLGCDVETHEIAL